VNDALISTFLAEAAEAPAGQRMHKLIALVAERCATICDIEAEAVGDQGAAAKSAANTMRAAFVDVARPVMKPIALATKTFAERRRDH
jgi:hypothetical protein